MRRRTILLLAGALLVASSESPSGPLYETSAMVLDNPEQGPELCLGIIALPDPPICGGVPLERWDWGAVDGAEESDGTIWGEYHVTGTYDGEVLTVRDVGPPDEPARTDDGSFEPACPAPKGGWPPPQNDLRDIPGRVTAAAEAEPDFAGLWISYYDNGKVGVVAIDPTTRAELLDRYDGRVEVEAHLTPVE